MPKPTYGSSGTCSKRPGKRAAIRAIQNGQPFIYALATKQGAIKIGFSHDVAVRVGNINFGGTERILGFRPGTWDEEQAIHDSLVPYALPYVREYYYPTGEVIAVVMDIASHFNLYRPNDHHDFPDLHQIAEVVESLVATRHPRP